MKVKGKLIGGVLGALFGGPIGIALGLAIGHACDSVAESSETSLATRAKFIELACDGISKIAKVDGRVSESEIAEIENIFKEMRLDDETRQTAIGYFRRAKNSDETLADVARRFCAVFPNPLVRESFFIMLLRVALSDGDINESEKSALLAAAAQLGVNAAKFPGLGESFRGEYRSERGGQSVSRSELAEAYATLGVTCEASFEEVKKVYHAKCKELHPDVLRAKGVGEYAISAMESELKRINDAYSLIKNLNR